MLNGKSILITGGTGSFGRKFLDVVLSRFPKLRRIVIFSRDEMKQYEMSQLYPTSKCPQIRYFIGDVRDRDRLHRALEGIEVVIHAAALKQVPAAEYNPFECIKTNVFGAQNVIEASIDAEVEKVIALSTDKAAAPINLYGATKLCSDKLFVAGNSMKGTRKTKFSVVRYGNVFGSRGSVVPFFLKKRHEGVLPITDERMTRFNITLDHGVDLVLKALEIMWGGEIFIPKIPSLRIVDLAEAVAPGCQKKIIGIRPGEKLHEEMITETDALNTIEFDDYFVILPSMHFWDIKAFTKANNGKPCPQGFRYNSEANSEWMTVEQIRSLVKSYVESTARQIRKDDF